MKSRIDLSDVTFIIPYFRDSLERGENLQCILKFLKDNFDTKINLVESGSQISVYNSPDKGYKHSILFGDDFHRTKVINYGIINAETPYIAIYDTDCVFEPENILKAVQLLREGLTLTYPYYGSFYDIERSYITDGVIKKHNSYVTGSCGGACFLNREHYLKCGLENEHLLGAHVPEDKERYERVKNLGYLIGRVEGDCYHIMHPPSKDSKANPYATSNNVEYLKVKNMDKKSLEKYVSEWEWTKI